MTDWIRKRFIPQYQNTADPAVRVRYGVVASGVGMATNLLLAAAKVGIGLVFHTISITGDGLNNLTDSVSAVVTLIGFRISSREADEEHPYGHGRMEYIATMVISMLMVVVGFSVLEQSVSKILKPQSAVYSWLVFAVLGGSVLVKLWQCFFYRKMGRAIESNTLRANARDSLNDVISTTAILISVALTSFTGYNTDGVMGALVAVFIMYSGVSLMRDTVGVLLGSGADEELARQVRDLLTAHEGVIGVHDLEVHSYGEGRLFASAHAEVPAKQDVMISHDLIDNIEREARRKLGLHLTIHMDPVATDDPEREALGKEIAEILKETDPRLQFHDLRLVRGNTHTNVLFDIVVPMRFSLSDEELTRRIGGAIRKNHPHYYAVIDVDRDFTRHN